MGLLHTIVEDLGRDSPYLSLRLELNCLKTRIDIVVLVHAVEWSKMPERLVVRGLGK